MPYYEVIYETGSKSIVNAPDEEALSRGLTEQQNRAKNGMPGGPTGHPAERVARVLEYDRHPADYGQDQSFSKEVALKTVSDLIDKVANDDGVVAKYDLTNAIHETSSAVVLLEDQTVHSSAYKMKEKRELKPTLWGGND